MNIYQRRGVDNGFVWSNIFDSFDKLFELSEISEPCRLNSYITSNQFPPSSIYVDKGTKDLHIQCALAGYNKDDIFVEFDDDKLKLIIDKGDQKEPEDRLFIQKGIKTPSSAEISFKVDTRFYDSNSTRVDFKDGLLEIKISPLEAVKPRKIPLFGERKVKELPEKTEPTE